MIDVMLVEDQRLYSSAMEAIINPIEDMRITAIAKNKDEAIRQLDETRPHVILLDIARMRMKGLQLTSHIKEQGLDHRVIMLTPVLDEELLISSVNVGADGYLLTEHYSDTLIHTIRQVHRGEIVISGKVARVLTEKIRNLTMDKKQLLATKLEKKGLSFTKRELDIAYLLIDNDTNKRIAQKLFLGEGTVKNYVSEIYAKLHIRNRKEAVDYLRTLLNQ